MQVYVQKPLTSRVIQRVKTKECVTQLMRIRLNDDISQNLSFDGLLRYVRTSGEEEINQLPRSERIKYTPKVVADEVERKEADKGINVLDDHEDIVFEGHYRYTIRKFSRTMEGKGANDLFQIVVAVVSKFGHRELWQGRVVLLGCSTAPMVKLLAGLLRQEFQREINVVGTKKGIKDSMGTEPYVYYKGDKSKTPINFTNPSQVEMAYLPELLEAQDEDEFTMLRWKMDEMGIGKGVQPIVSPEEIDRWDCSSLLSELNQDEDQ